MTEKEIMGFYGDSDRALAYARDTADIDIADREIKRQQKLKTYIKHKVPLQARKLD